MISLSAWEDGGALGGTRTPNLLIRSQMLYPLSYERGCLASLWHFKPWLCQLGSTGNDGRLQGPGWRPTVHRRPALGCGRNAVGAANVITIWLYYTDIHN